jgi:hypothetical protein
MASIDKIYCHKIDYLEFCKFWIKTKEQQLLEMGELLGLHPFYTEKDWTQFDFNKLKELGNSYFPDDYTNMPLMNNSVIWDLWLKKNCDIEFVTDRIDEQYGESYIMKFAKDFDFTQLPSVLSIESTDPDKDLLLYFYRKRGDDLKEGEIYSHEKIIFYGTTYLLKVIDDAIKAFNLEKRGSRLTVIVQFYGFVIKFNNGKHYKLIDEDEIEINNLFELSLSHFPEIKHSYSMKESADYEPEEIYISDEREAFDITQYKDFNILHFPRYIKLLPDYINKHIK